MNPDLFQPLDGPDGSAPPSDPARTEAAREWLESDEGARVRHALEDSDARTLEEQIELTRIPAPPFGEAERAARMAELMTEAGLTEVTVDREGNVVGHRPGRRPEPTGALVLAAHLDTVFPAGTPIEVQRSGDRIEAPGIADDGRGLAVLLAVARGMTAAEIRTNRPLVFAATVGEEGLGDLRGVRYLFSDEGAGHGAAGFVSIDGAGASKVVTHGLGSHRIRVRIAGPGGHSWVEWGTGNPIHLLSTVISRAAGIPLPAGTTLSTGRISGGTAVNAIPEEAWAELELRSLRSDDLDEVRTRLHDMIRAEIDAGNGRRSRGDELRLEIERIGDRPPGRTDPQAPLVQAALAATIAIGETPQLAVSSTDANLPMSLGIPAITIGGGGAAGAAHTVDEWYRNTKGPDGVVRALLTMLLADREPVGEG